MVSICLSIISISKLYFKEYMCHLLYFFIPVTLISTIVLVREYKRFRIAEVIIENQILHIMSAYFLIADSGKRISSFSDRIDIFISNFGILLDSKIVKFNQGGDQLKAVEIGFTVAGVAEVGDFEMPSAFYMGLGIGGLLIVIALFQKARSKKDKTWDGVVVDKRIKQPSYSDRQHGNYKIQYSAHIRLDNGKTKIVHLTKELFDYYQIGEHVRHHAGTSHILEKYDKSQDSYIYCIACTSKNEKNNNVCYRCKCPLLK